MQRYIENLHQDVISNPIFKTVDRVGKLLGEASRHGLQVEVVVWALERMSENPSMTTEEAIEYGFNEWVK